MQFVQSPVTCISCNKVKPNYCCKYCQQCYDAMPITCTICHSKFAGQHSAKCTMYVNEEGKEVNKAMPTITPLTVGTKVEKVGGDYTFVGTVVAVFYKLNGTSLRFVVEDDRGVLHVYSEKNLRPVVV